MAADDKMLVWNTIIFILLIIASNNIVLFITLNKKEHLTFLKGRDLLFTILCIQAKETFPFYSEIAERSKDSFCFKLSYYYNFIESILEALDFKIPKAYRFISIGDSNTLRSPMANLIALLLYSFLEIFTDLKDRMQKYTDKSN